MIEDQADFEMQVWLFKKQATEALSAGVSADVLQTTLNKVIEESKPYHYRVFNPETGEFDEAENI